MKVLATIIKVDIYIIMKIKTYTNVFSQAQEHPQAQQFYEESLARIRLADAIHKERTAQSLSMKALAEKAHTTPAIISRIENAQMSAGIDLVMKIYRALGKDKIELSCTY
jgi:ribosome-binding protein aMBF1 (putative translation factor)